MADKHPVPHANLTPAPQLSEPRLIEIPDRACQDGVVDHSPVRTIGSFLN